MEPLMSAASGAETFIFRAMTLAAGLEPASFTTEEVRPEEIRTYGSAVESAYGSFDGILAGVLGREEDVVRVLVLSDHGFRDNRDPKRPTSSGWHRTEGLFVAEGPGF